jgi:regulator of protease activity HflC (stomatin/prohibitin superfamily)
MKQIYKTLFATLGLAGLLSGCTSGDIPQAHKGQMFDRTGALALFQGGGGLSGPVLGPGTYWTGLYDELRVVDCSQSTMREPLESLTKDGVQFKLDVYITFSADCADDSISGLLETLSPDETGVITSLKLYETYARPAIGEAVRETISPHRANDINERREEILGQIRGLFIKNMEEEERKKLRVFDVVLSNLDYPDAMDQANTERAVQGVLKDKAIAERERVTAEIETTEMRKVLSQAEGAAEAARIDEIGAALRRNPEYLQFDLQQKMPEIYKAAGSQGNMIITAPNPQILVNPSANQSSAAAAR